MVVQHGTGTDVKKCEPYQQAITWWETGVVVYGWRV